MSSNKGITMMSLVIYIITMVLVVGIIATITSFFYTNVINLGDESKNVAEFTKFNMYFLEEIKNKDNAVKNLKENSITFTSGNSFTFQDNSIYYNSIRICDNVKSAQFKVDNTKNNVIDVILTIGDNMEYTKTSKYVISNIW